MDELGLSKRERGCIASLLIALCALSVLMHLDIVTEALAWSVPVAAVFTLAIIVIIVTFHLLPFAVPMIGRATEAVRKSRHGRKQAYPSAANANPPDIESGLATLKDMAVYTAYGAAAGALVGGLLGLLLSLTTSYDILAGTLETAGQSGFLGFVGAGVGALIGDDKTILATWLGALFGGFAGALGGEALGAESKALQGIVAIAHRDVQRALTDIAAIAGGYGAAAGMVAGAFTMLAIDSMRGWAGVKRGLWGALLFAVAGALAAPYLGSDAMAGLAAGALGGAIVGALLPGRSSRSMMKQAASAGARKAKL